MAHPYSGLPDRNFWKRSVAQSAWQEVFAQERGRFLIAPDDRVVSAGSCFAQRISRFLKGAGKNFSEFESPHPLLSASDAESLGYGRFSARYGNIYTGRQLAQLVDEAFGVVPYAPRISQNKSSRYIDLRRPNMNSFGFESEDEAVADRSYHLSCVRRMFLEADLFIFTLGLTEAWRDDEDGTIYGIHPSVALGVDSDRSVSKINFDYVECFNDMVYVVNYLRGVNPRLRFIFTVSPVALAATHQETHVLLATTYSKSVLRAVSGRLAEICPAADYFFSYEIFFAAQSFGQFLSEDLRDVSSRGVDLAMKLFMNMYFEPGGGHQVAAQANTQSAPATELVVRERGPAEIECDEVMNSLFPTSC